MLENQGFEIRGSLFLKNSLDLCATRITIGWKINLSYFWILAVQWKKKINKMAHMKRTYKNMTYNLRWRECSEGGMTLQMNS